MRARAGTPHAASAQRGCPRGWAGGRLPTDDAGIASRRAQARSCEGGEMPAGGRVEPHAKATRHPGESSPVPARRQGRCQGNGRRMHAGGAISACGKVTTHREEASQAVVGGQSGARARSPGCSRAGTPSLAREQSTPHARAAGPPVGSPTPAGRPLSWRGWAQGEVGGFSHHARAMVARGLIPSVPSGVAREGQTP